MIKRSYTIGRAADNDIRIKDISVSRRHAIISLSENGQARLQDCNSRNGTFVNGRQISSALVKAQDQIAFGAYKCSLEELVPNLKTAIQPTSQAAPSLPGIMAGLCVLIIIFGIIYVSSNSDMAPVEIIPPEPAPSTQAVPQVPEKKPAPQNMKQRIEQATVIVLTNSGYGSGFFITPNTLLTNRHVVQGINSVEICSKFLGKCFKARVTVTGQGELHDYAVLVAKINNSSYLPISPKVERGDKIYSWGYPGFITDHIIKNRQMPEVLLTSGEVSAVQKIRNENVILHTAQIAQGNSGGPLVNEKGSAVGINTLVAPDKKLNSQFSIALPGKDLIAFLRANRVPFVEGD